MLFRTVMWIVMLLGGVIGGYWLDGRWFPSIHDSWIFHLVSFTIGALLLKGVLTVSRNTGRALARNGREGDLPRLETNVLVTSGRYALMRHPMHLGLLFFPLAIAFLVGSPSFILVIAPLEMLFMIVMIATFEEREAIEKFGQAYREYQRNVPMFCLKPRCISELFKEE